MIGDGSSDKRLLSSTDSPFDYQKWVHDMKREDAHRAHDNHAILQFYKRAVD
jgi:hypothetical protein